MSCKKAFCVKKRTHAPRAKSKNARIRIKTQKRYVSLCALMAVLAFTVSERVTFGAFSLNGASSARVTGAKRAVCACGNSAARFGETVWVKRTVTISAQNKSGEKAL